jgi:hypothetical protein
LGAELIALPHADRGVLRPDGDAQARKSSTRTFRHFAGTLK